MTQIKTALLSFGMSGKLFHAPFINAHNGFELAGAFERSKKQIQSIYPSVLSYDSIDELLSDPSIELVVVNTPTNSHYEYAKKALLAGKHIIVEKAFTSTLAEAIELKELSAAMQKKISVFQSRRWDSDFKTVQKVLHQNVLGNIVDVEINFERYRPELSGKLHKEIPQPGAGLLNDIGPHVIDQALVLFGMPQYIYASLRITRTGSQVDDWFNIILYYPALTVRLRFSYFAKEQSPGYIIQGSKGSFFKSRADIQENQLLAGLQPNIEGWGIEPKEEEGLLYVEKNGVTNKEFVATEQGNYMAYYEGIYDALRKNGPLPVTCDDGIRVMQLIEAARKSNLEGKKIKLSEIN